MTKSGNYKIIIAITALIVVFVFLYFFTGVFGETRLGVTLRTNPNLENGLVAHYTFDGEYETGTFEFAAGGATTTDPNDGDYKKMVEYLIEKDRFKKILFPNKKFASSLYKKLGSEFCDYLRNVQSDIGRRQNKKGS